MNRKLISLCGVIVAVVSFTIGGPDAEARNRCGRQRNNCCQQSINQGWQQNAYSASGWGRNNGNCCGQNSNIGYQQTNNFGSQPMVGNCCQQQANFASYQPSNTGSSAYGGTVTPTSWNTQNGTTYGQPNMLPTSINNAAQPPVEAAPRVESTLPATAPQPAL